MKNQKLPVRRLTRQQFLTTSLGAGVGLVMLGGCGSDSGGQASGNIKAWGWDIAAASLREVVPMFKENDSKVKVKVDDVGRLDLYDKVTTGLAAGGSGLPDLFMLETDRLPSYIVKFPQGLANLSDMGAGKFKDKIADTKWPQAESDGTIYAFPWDIGPTGIFYRVDFFDKAGVKPDDISTWDDYIDAGKEIKKSTGKQLVGIDAGNDDGVFRMMLNQQGTYYFNKAGEITLATPEAVAAMEKVKKMYDADLVVNVNGYDGGVTAFKNERVVSAAAGVWYSGTITDQAPDQKGKWDAFQLPAFESGGNRAANLGGSNMVINANSENVDAAYAYSKFAMTDPDAQMYMMKNYGLFPSLLSTYDDPFFDKKVPYFNDQPIYRMFADEVSDIPKAYYTEDYARAFARSSNAQAQVLLNNGDPEKALTNAAQQLAQETGREIA